MSREHDDPNEIAERPGPQVQGWVRQIRKEQAAGLDLRTASEEARLSFENLTGSPLSDAQSGAWKAAIAFITRGAEEFSNRATPALRRPRPRDWYGGPQADDSNWPPMRAHLLVRQNWSETSVQSLDRSSTDIVALAEDPSLLEFRGRGMVVGYVQSGKTANMLAVTAKAVDSGYKFVIFLAGLTNSLRRQTQHRFEGDLRAQNRYGWHLHTTADDDGDFRTPPNQWFSVMDPAQVAVIKKNVTPLRRLVETIARTPPALRERIPVLIIDDECDQASVNASGSQYDLTAINALIRRLLSLLPRVQYIGYTATPFANVLINPHTPDGQADDLYPADFIVALPRPEGYSGTDSLFGEPVADADAGSPAEAGLDMVRYITDGDAQAVRPKSAREREQFEASVPPSLDEALRWFILASAAREARGDGDRHSSMLVHTTVYTTAHQRLANVIEDWLADFRSEWADGSLHEALSMLWAEEQERVPAALFGLDLLGFDDLVPGVQAVLDALVVVVENSASESRLDFTGGSRKYVVVGGSVLARGLTIEGLAVSYFVRSSSQYDTLLQMGRWFGFRRGYGDLPRIWMTPNLAGAFRDLSIVESEIRDQIGLYAARGLTPQDFAVRIRQIPGMAVTAARKMIAAESCDVSFSGEHLQTIRFPYRDRDLLEANWAAGAQLVEDAVSVADWEKRPAGWLCRAVPYDVVRRFLATYSASSQDQFASGLLRWLDGEDEGEATFPRWNVGIVEPAAGPVSTNPLGAFGDVHMVRRSRLSVPREDGLADIKALMSRRDVLIDCEGGPAGDDWAGIKAYRQTHTGGSTPLLLLYAIDRVSIPAAGSHSRIALDAAMDVLGVGLILPDVEERKSYVRVRLSQEDASEDVLADIPEAI